MSATTAIVEAGAPAPKRASTRLFLAGLLSRTWLWFVGGCLIVTLLPILVGWRPYVVESGSMAPRIGVGDIVLAAPEPDVDVLLGRVTVFDDPVRPGVVKTHRVIAVNDDGSLVTKGDANAIADTAPVTIEQVRGLGRLLVSYAGMPFIWLRTQQFAFLALFLLSLLVAAWVVSRDQDEDETGSDDPEGGQVVPLPAPSAGGGSATQKAASTPLDPGLRRTATRPLGVRIARTAWIVAAVMALTVPTTQAAFAASTRSTANAWSVGNWSYTTAVTDLGPWLYWKLDDSTTTVADASGNGRTGRYYTGSPASTSGFTQGITGALTSDTPNRAVTLNGTTACIGTSGTTGTSAPTQLTEVVWFRTTSTRGGKLVGFEAPRQGVAQAGSGGSYDRHLYMDGAGKVWFGVYNGAHVALSSPGALNDGQWHMAAAAFGTGGMKLWIDGTLVATNTNSVGEGTVGWFRAGCGNLAGWGGSWTGSNNPTTSTSPTQNRPFAGSLDEISIWQSVLTTTQVRNLYLAH